MIKFTVLTKENAEGLIESISKSQGATSYDVRKIVLSFLEMIGEDPDVEVGVCSALGCILVRIFDMGRYMFPYPIAAVDGADVFGAAELIREYAVREEIGLVYTDVPREYLGGLVSSLCHTVADIEAGGESYRVEAQSECSLLERIPELSYGKISLTPILERDIALSAQLNRDAEINKYWGYDYREDSPSANDGYFLAAAEREFSMGVAMTLAIRLDGEYIGEAVFYEFDFVGGAQIGLRILKGYQGMGLGKAALEAMMELGGRIGLMRLRATVDARNSVSLGLFDSSFERVLERDGRVYYERDV